MIPLAGGVLELLYVFSNKYSEDTLGTMASGPIMPISCFWYLYSNYLCANASIKYCNITPYWLLVLAWSGLMGGGLDHIIETWQWGMGWLKGDHKQRHKRFGNLWLDLQPYGGMLAPMFFGITSIIGILAVVCEVFYRETTSTGFAVLIAAIMLPTLYYETQLSEESSFTGGPSTVGFHLAHMLITHVGLSLMPAVVVWLLRPEIDLFTWPF